MNETQMMQDILNDFVNSGRYLSKQGEQLRSYLLSSIRPQKNKKVKGRRTFDEVQVYSKSKGIEPDELAAIYAEYFLTYNEQIGSRENIIEEPKKPYFPTTDETSTDQKLDDLINRTAFYRNLLSKNDFAKVIKNWDKGNKTVDEWYDLYYNKIYQEPGWTIKLNDPRRIKYTVYKSPDKRASLKKLLNFKTTGDRKEDLMIDAKIRKQVNEEKDEEDYIPNSFPMKNNRKYFQHLVYSPGTYMIDIMFTGDLAYLIAINANSRYMYAELLTPTFDFGKGFVYGVNGTFKDSAHFIEIMDKLKAKGMKPKFLIGDDEGCFHSDVSQKYYQKEGIEWKGVRRIRKGVYPDFMPREQNNKTEPLHTSLGIIDRAIRTLRDMAYNAHVGIITKKEMEDIVEMYNNAPHKTLTKYAGEPTTPIQVQNNPELEKFIIRKICQENFNVKSKDGFDLPEDSYVKVYNDTDKFQKRRSIIQPGRHKVGKYSKGLYEVIETKSGMVQFLPRYRLQPENRKKYKREIDV